MLTKSEIVSLAERIFTTRDYDRADAVAQLHQIECDHGNDVMQDVIEQMQMLDRLRHEAVMEVYKDLPHDLPFEEALKIKASRNDPCAQGWQRQADGTFAKMVPGSVASLSDIATTTKALMRRVPSRFLVQKPGGRFSISSGNFRGAIRN